MEIEMRHTLIASMALLVAAAPASAGMLLQPKENDHKGFVGTWSVQSSAAGQYAMRIEARARYGTTLTTSDAAPGQRAFILSATENDHKKVENGYAR
jgi:hypothetical protein